MSWWHHKKINPKVCLLTTNQSIQFLQWWKFLKNEFEEYSEDFTVLVLAALIWNNEPAKGRKALWKKVEQINLHSQVETN